MRANNDREMCSAAQLRVTPGLCTVTGRSLWKGGPSRGPRITTARAQPACSACMTSRPGAYAACELATPWEASRSMPRHEQRNNCVRTRAWSAMEVTQIRSVSAMALVRTSFALLAILLSGHEVCGHVTMICTSTPSDAGCVAGGVGGVEIWLGTYHGNQRYVCLTRVHDGYVCV